MIVVKNNYTITPLLQEAQSNSVLHRRCYDKVEPYASTAYWDIDAVPLYSEASIRYYNRWPSSATSFTSLSGTRRGPIISVSNSTEIPFTFYHAGISDSQPFLSDNRYWVLTSQVDTDGHRKLYWKQDSSYIYAGVESYDDSAIQIVLDLHSIIHDGCFYSVDGRPTPSYAGRLNIFSRTYNGERWSIHSFLDEIPESNRHLYFPTKDDFANANEWYKTYKYYNWVAISQDSMFSVSPYLDTINDEGSMKYVIAKSVNQYYT